MSMYNASIPVFEIGLNALSAVLDKAEAYAEAKGIDPTVLLTAQLYPDMFAFTRQVQIVCDQAKYGGARLAGIDPPNPSMRTTRRRSPSSRRALPRRSLL